MTKRLPRLAMYAVAVVVVGFGLWWGLEFHLKPYLREVLHNIVSIAVNDALNHRNVPVASASEGPTMADGLRLDLAIQKIAGEESARYVLDHMWKASAFRQREDLFDLSLKQIGTDLREKGLYCEFGVYRGESVNFLAERLPEVTWHGFDSFDGLPADWRTRYPKGTFDIEGLPVVRKNVKLHKGWFCDSVPGWAKEHPGPLAFVHFDADIYESTKEVLDLLADRFVPGTVVQFDEYLNYPGWKHGEYQAWQEFVQAHHVQYEYLGYCEWGAQVAVRVTRLASPTAK